MYSFAPCSFRCDRKKGTKGVARETRFPRWAPNGVVKCVWPRLESRTNRRMPCIPVEMPRNTSAKVASSTLENYVHRLTERCIDPRVKVHIEKGQRAGCCLQHLLALSSSKDIGNNLVPEFFAFPSFTFANSRSFHRGYLLRSFADPRCASEKIDRFRFCAFQ